MIVVIIRSGATTDARCHDGFETFIYLLTGRGEERGMAGLLHTCLNEAGDFRFIAVRRAPPAAQPERNGPARALVARNTPSEQESVMTYSMTL